MQDHGRYSVCGEIASGSTATVFLAEDKVLRRKVALKRLHPHLLGNTETVKRFRQEAVAIASLSHENIIQVYDYGDRDRDLYLAMEYVDGASLENLMAQSSRILPNLAALACLHQLMRGLAAAHGAGIVHRDIKPSNVLVDRKGCVRIADFGIAFLAEENSITKTGSYLGTPVYSSPEQANGLPASDKTDIFSSGIVFYRCFTGHLPFQGENSHAILRAIVELQPRKPASLNRRLFPGLSELTMAMLCKDPEKRPSAADCAAELLAVASRLGFGPEPARVRRFLADPAAYPEQEREEIGTHFQKEAGLAQLAGERRKAMKLKAQAELYSVPATEVDAGEEGALARLSSVPRWRKAALVGLPLAAALLVAGAWFLAPDLRNIEVTPPAGAESASSASSPPAIQEAVQPVAPSPAQVTEKLPDETAPMPSLAAAPRRPPASKASRPPRKEAAPAASAAARVAAPASASSSAPAVPAPESSAEKPSEVRPADGGLLVKSNPPFASVKVDGRDAGRTPFKSPLMLSPGEHEVVLEREGCRPHTSTVKVESGSVLTLRLTLDRLAAPAVAESKAP